MIALDTNTVSLLLKGEIDIAADSTLYIPYVVVAELRSGVASGSDPKKYGAVLDQFFNGTDVVVSPGLSEEVIMTYVEIYGYLKKKGTPVSPNDLWIAAECMYLSLALLTRDTDFQKIPHIRKA